MAYNWPEHLELDSHCFELAFREWNTEHTGFDNPDAHVPWYQLNTQEQQEIMQRAQKLKREALASREVNA